MKRVLPLEGTCNVRDLGGYPAADNKTVVWHKIFRAGDLNTLSHADLSYMQSLKIKNYVDFRADGERQKAPDMRPESVVNIYPIPIDPGSIEELQSMIFKEPMQTMTLVYKMLVVDMQPQYRQFFKLLEQKDNAPLLFHCSAGKDRTGMAAAFFLGSLGVNRQAIREDYMLSNQCLGNKYAAMINAEPAMKPLMVVYEQYIDTALNLIDSEYGGMEAYLANNLQVDMDLMRKIYLR